jgi:hypothetical protein
MAPRSKRMGILFSMRQISIRTDVEPAPATAGPGEFSFDGNHDNDAWLLRADARGKLQSFVDHVSFGPARLERIVGTPSRRHRCALSDGPAKLCRRTSNTTPKAKQGTATLLRE